MRLMNIIRLLKINYKRFFMEYFGEHGYMQLIGDVLNTGVDIPDRTGVGTRAIFDAKVIFNVGETFPFSTSRIAGLRPAFEEFKMFMAGETQTNTLAEKGVKFWIGNTTRDFLDKRGLKHLPSGCMGKAYGFQFRHAGGSLEVLGGEETPLDDRKVIASGGVDQLSQLVEGLKKDPFSRRHLVTFLSPTENDEMALTPCWHSHQFVVLPDNEGNKVLHLKLMNRSLDNLYGFLFAVQQYALFQVVLAKMLGFKVGNLSADLTHIHIYENQFDFAKEAIERELGEPGVLLINKDIKTLDDIISLDWENIEVKNLNVNKKTFKTKRPPMAV